jgi:general stress protein YciG
MTTETHLIPAPVPHTGRRLTRRQNRNGGRTTYRRHGREHFVDVGHRGGVVCYQRHGPELYHRIGVQGAAIFHAKYSREVKQAIGRYAGRISQSRSQIERYFLKLEIEVGTEVAIAETEGQRCSE